MTPQEAAEAAIEHARQTAALTLTEQLLHWDRQTMMPAPGAAQRAEQSEALATVIHARQADPRLGDWLSAAVSDGAAHGSRMARDLALLDRDYRRATAVPGRLAARIAGQGARGYTVWVEARRAGDVAAFLPELAEMVTLRREEAGHVAAALGFATPYDAALDAFEPGMTSARLLPILEGLADPLASLAAAILDSGRVAPRLAGRFPADAQRALAARVAPILGYDPDAAGRLDLAVHPFCSGEGADVRITTRIDEADPLGCLYSTIHEIGHAIYKLNMPRAGILSPSGRHPSLGVHESQSRLLENQIGRSRAFAEWLFPVLAETFGDMGLEDADALYAAVNHVGESYIRTEADEVQYNLHVLLRTRLERDMLEGRLDPRDIEEAWNEGFRALFGRTVPDPARGVLQDVHWAEGLFGYFPTYTLGNVYAAELFAKMERDLPALPEDIASGRLGPLLGWLSEGIHARANEFDAEALIAAATGRPPAPDALIAYLRAKFGELYGL